MTTTYRLGGEIYIDDNRPIFIDIDEDIPIDFYPNLVTVAGLLKEIITLATLAADAITTTRSNNTQITS